MVETFRAWQGTLGWRATAASWNILGSHDSARIRTLVGGDAAVHRVAVGLQFTLPGVPMVFAGDEIGLEGVNGEDARRTMPWHRRDEWDDRTLGTYADLARLRREHTALRRGGLRWAYVDADTIAYLREHPDEDVLVVARRAAGSAFVLPLTSGRHLVGSDPGGAGLVAGPGGVDEGERHRERDDHPGQLGGGGAQARDCLPHGADGSCRSLARPVFRHAWRLRRTRLRGS